MYRNVSCRALLTIGIGLSSFAIQGNAQSSPDDADGDGLPDTWELQYLGTLGYGANDDPGGIGRTLLQSYQQGLIPWPAPIIPNGLRAWYRADVGVVADTDNRVVGWPDLSGSGFHVVSSGDSSRDPEWESTGFNGHPTVSFNGSMALVTADTEDLANGAQDVTVIAVVKPAATQGWAATIYYWGTDGNLSHGFTSEGTPNQFELHWDDANYGEQKSPRLNVTAGQVQVLSAEKNGASASVYMNGTLEGMQSETGTMAPSISALALGNAAAPYYGFNGDIAEILVYNRALSDSERQQIEQALEAKYIAADSDGDGLPDAWEMQYLGSLSYGAADDPGNVGRTLLQSYQQGLSPWPAPSVATGLRAWYRADFGVTKDGSNAVSAWADLSGGGFHVLQTGDPSRQPEWETSAFNGHPAVTFNGSAALVTPGLRDLRNGAQDVTVIAVVKPAATQGWAATIYYWGTDGNLSHGLTSEGTPNEFELHWDDANYGEQKSPRLSVAPGQVQV
ncbi:MAG TPA: LamG-like jellyroll fold domain-containing protein, partial [Candidatus Didemnitutus sp.]